MDKKKENSPVKFGVLGCGRICGKHFSAIDGASDAQLVAVADSDEVRMRARSKEQGVPGYSSLVTMLDAHPDMDVVSILTPSGDHASSALVCLEAGRHVLVEKPMALTMESAEQMILRADQVGKRLFVVKQNRYNKPVVAVRRKFEEGAFGRIVMGTVRVRWCREQAYYDQDAWRGTWRWDGGVLTNQASHHIDLLQWFLGEPESVYAVSRTALVDIETEDTAAAIVQFKGGAIGVIEATTATRPKDLEGSFSLMGEKGSVEIGGFAVNELKHWNFSDSKESFEALHDSSESPPNVYGFGHQLVLENVCNAIRSEKQALVEGWEALKSLRLISALYESIETGKPVSLSFSPKACRLGQDA